MKVAFVIVLKQRRVGIVFRVNCFKDKLWHRKKQLKNNLDANQGDFNFLRLETEYQNIQKQSHFSEIYFL